MSVSIVSNPSRAASNPKPSVINRPYLKLKQDLNEFKDIVSDINPAILSPLSGNKKVKKAYDIVHDIKHNSINNDLSNDTLNILNDIYTDTKEMRSAHHTTQQMSLAISALLLSAVPAAVFAMSQSNIAKALTTLSLAPAFLAGKFSLQSKKSVNLLSQHIINNTERAIEMLDTESDIAKPDL